MSIFLKAPAGNIFVQKVRTDKAGPFVAGGDSLDKRKRGQIQPPVVIFTGIGVFVNHVCHFSNVRRLLEINEIFLVAAVGNVFSQDVEFPLPLLALFVRDCHFDRCFAVIALIIGDDVRFVNDCLDIRSLFGRNCFLCCKKQQQKTRNKRYFPY